MNCLEVYIKIDLEKYNKVIQAILNILSNFVTSGFSLKLGNKLLDYASIHYIRHINNYPILILNTLKLLLGVYISSKEKLMKEIKTRIKSKRSSKLISTIFTVLDYFLYHVQNEDQVSQDDQHYKFKTQDPIFTEYFRTKSDVIDKIVSICIYFIGDFDWMIFNNMIKDLLKEEAYLKKAVAASVSFRKATLKENLITYLMKLTDKTKAIESIILSSIFNCKKGEGLIINEVSYKAFMSLIFNNPKELLAALEIKVNLKEASKDVISYDMLELALQYVKFFTSKAKEMLVNDLMNIMMKQPKFIKELSEANSMAQHILELEDGAELVNIKAEILCAATNSVHPHWCWCIAGTGPHKLSVLERALDITMENFVPINNTNGINTVLKCVDFTYIAEDILEEQFIKEAPNEAFTKVLCKLVLLLNKADLLYLSAPIWTIFEQRETVQMNKSEEKSHQEREGGTLRILLKLILIGVKKAKSAIFHNMLSYFIFKDKTMKKQIKEYIGRKSEKKSKGKKCQSLINMILRKDAQGMKQYAAINEMYVKKVILKEFSIMSQKKVGSESFPKNSNYFEEAQTLSLHLLVSLVQLAYFELFHVESISDILKGNFALDKLVVSYQQDKKYSDTYKYIVSILKRITVEDKNNDILRMVTTELTTFLDVCTSKLNSGVTKLTLDNVYSGLDTQRNAVVNKKLEAGELEMFTKKFQSFTGDWIRFVSAILNMLKLDSDMEAMCGTIMELLLESENVFTLQPVLLFLTLHPFYKIDSYVASLKTSLEVNPDVNVELIQRLRDEFEHVDISKTKLKHDVITVYFRNWGQVLYNRMMQEQRSELGCWFNKNNEKHKKSLYTYVKQQYEKIRYWNKKVDKSEQVFDKFVTLSKSRDRLNRSLRLKEHNLVKDGSSIACGYGYLRKFILKKMLLRNICQNIIQADLYSTDFRFDFIKRLFKASFITKGTAEMNSVTETAEIDKIVIREMMPYEVEIIAINETGRGKLAVYKDLVIFLNAEELSRISVVKIWEIRKIAEVIVRRYKLVRQAVEIYLSNNNSVFVSFTDKKCLHKFVKQLEKEIAKKKGAKPAIVLKPEEYFVERQFTNLWTTGLISNFDYLMLINKYSGRSFHDLNQYPIFPWIIQNHKDDIKDFTKKEVLRPLGMTIASMNQDKMKSADQKFDSLKKGLNPQYQFDTHYLPPDAVFGYMIRLNPYAFLTAKYSNSVYEKSCLFQSISGAWLNSLTNMDDNKELIPEFFYLPEIFQNHNFRTLDFTEENKHNDFPLGQVAVPKWAKSHHEFIRINATVLESNAVSFELNKWIDLIFGERQQDPKSYNMYMPMLDEDYVANMKSPLNESQIMKLQKSGVNPIKLFKERHPARDEKKISERGQYAIFYDQIKSSTEQVETNSNETPTEKKQANDITFTYALLMLKSIEENQAVNYIMSFERKVIAILSSQKLYQTKDGYINVPHERTLFFEKKEIELFPYKPFYNIASNLFSFNDSQRCFISTANGSQLITCRHYDNSWRIIDCSSGAVKDTIYFHDAMVNCICITETSGAIFTGSNDGVVAMWKKNFSQPVWYAANHNLGIVSMDACEKLGLIMTAGVGNLIVIRKISDGKLVRIIKPEYKPECKFYTISLVRFTYRGYVIVISKCDSTRTLDNDDVHVFTINGEEICQRKISMSGNVIVISETGYEFIIGGNEGKLFKYQLLTLNEKNMMNDLDLTHKATNTTLDEFTNSCPSITAISLTMQEGCQQLILGTNTGMFFIYKYSPRLLGYKIFDALPGLI